MARPDGRVAAQLRPFLAEPAALTRADGSARWAHGQTECLASVYGPCEAKRAREKISSATLEVIVRPLSGLPGPVEREAEQLLGQTLEHVVLTHLHPRTAISVIVQVLADDGSLLAAAFHAAALALVHAGVPMRGMLGSCTAALTADGAVVLDPCADEERDAAGVITLAYLVQHNARGTADRSMLVSHCTGRLQLLSQLEATQQAAEEAAVVATVFMRQSLTRSIGSLADAMGLAQQQQQLEAREG